MIICARCQRPNEPNHRICLGCGTPLAQAAGQSPGPTPFSSGESSGAAPAPYPFDPPSRPAVAAPPPSPQTHSGFTDPFGPPPVRARADENICSRCSTQNPAGFRFCGNCGNALAPIPPPQAQAPASNPPGWKHPSHTPLGHAQANGATMIQMAPPTPALARAQVILLNEEGAPAGSLTLEGGPHRLGRKHGPPFADDAFLDPNHVTVTATSAGLVIEDRGTVNGVFVRLEGRCELNDGDQFRAGQELLVFEKLAEPAQLGDAIEVLGSPNPGYWGRVGVLVAPRHLGRAMPIAGANFVIGRDAGDLLFPEDGYVSARHCQISNEGGRFYIEDLGSSNGTYLRARSHQTLPYGSYALIGQQLFRIEMG